MGYSVAIDIASVAPGLSKLRDAASDRVAILFGAASNASTGPVQFIGPSGTYSKQPRYGFSDWVLRCDIGDLITGDVYVNNPSAAAQPYSYIDIHSTDCTPSGIDSCPGDCNQYTVTDIPIAAFPNSKQIVNGNPDRTLLHIQQGQGGGSAFFGLTQFRLAPFTGFFAEQSFTYLELRECELGEFAKWQLSGFFSAGFTPRALDIHKPSYGCR